MLKKIDNTNLIKSLLVFPERTKQEKEQFEYFYVVQLLQRQKDNPTKPFGNPNFRNNSNRTIQQFQIYSLEDFDLKIQTIKDMSEYYQARAYIGLNIRDSRNVYNELYINMAIRHKTNNYTHLHRIFNEAVGEANCSKSKQRWIVDLDGDVVKFKDIVKQNIVKCQGGGDNNFGQVYAEIPTVNGLHLITSSFNRKAFNDYQNEYAFNRYPDIDIHNNNPTILYFNNYWFDEKEKKSNV